MDRRVLVCAIAACTFLWAGCHEGGAIDGNDADISADTNPADGSGGDVDAGADADTGTDTSVDTATDADVPDGLPLDILGNDTLPEVEDDIAVDVPVDIVPDVPVDIVPDVPVDVDLDIPVDVDLDIPVDVDLDIPVDIVPDVPVDVDLDVPVDVDPDISVDITVDISVDADPDVQVDVPVDVLKDTPVTDIQVDVDPDVSIDIVPDTKPDAGFDIAPDTKPDVDQDILMDAGLDIGTPDIPVFDTGDDAETDSETDGDTSPDADKDTGDDADIKPDTAMCNDADDCVGLPLEQCQEYACVAGACIVQDLADATPCSDGNACTLGDACHTGKCVPNSTPDCGGPTACVSAATCDPTGVDGNCAIPGTPINEGASCADGLFCNGDEMCAAGVCLAASVACATDETCDEDTDMCVAPTACGGKPDGTVCGRMPSECDNGETCVGGDCVDGGFAPATKECGDSDSTTCNGADMCDGNGACDANLTAAGEACGDASDTTCTDPDTCDGAGACLENHVTGNVSCGGDCVTQFCMAGTCSSIAVITPAGTPCGDASISACDAADSCDGAGTCDTNEVADNDPCVVGDANECTEDLCQAGACESTVTPGAACGDTDSNACTKPDTCAADGTCDANNELDGTTCDTSDTDCLKEACASGTCTPEVLPEDSACGDPATTTCSAPDSCDADGACQPNNLPGDIVCEDGDPCTTDDSCDDNGLCASGPVDPACAAAGENCGDPKVISALPYANSDDTSAWADDYAFAAGMCATYKNSGSVAFGAVGPGDGVNLPAMAGEFAYPEFTFSAWVNPAGGVLGVGSQVLAIQLPGLGGGTLPGYAIVLDAHPNVAGAQSVQVAPFGPYTAGSLFSGLTPIQGGEWTHITVSISSVTGQTQIWVNGMPDPMLVPGADAPLVGPILAGSTNLAVDINAGGYGALLGAMDEVAFFPRVLDNNEVNDLYSDSNSGPMRLGADHWFRMEQPGVFADSGFVPVPGQPVNDPTPQMQVPPQLGAGSGHSDVVYAFTAPAAGWYAAGISEAAFASSIYILSDCDEAGQACLDQASQQAVVAPNDRLIFFADADQLLHIVVDGYDGSGPYKFSLQAVNDVVINEVDYDQPSSDTAEFVELFNANPFPVRMDHTVLELVNGNGGAVYGMGLFAPQRWIPAGGYWVFGATSVLGAMPAGVPSAAVPNGSIQNGNPDGVRLVTPSGAFVDGVAYEGTMAGTGEGVSPGTPLNASNALSLTRCGNGADTDDNAVDFGLSSGPTAGATNSLCP